MAKIKIWGFRCERCGHEWAPREPNEAPTVCPKCKSPYWNRPRRGEIPSEERIKPKGFLAHELDGKTVEFDLQRGIKRIAGSGKFVAVEGADGFMKVSIWASISPTESFEIKLSQAEADCIESQMLSRKSRFRCVHSP
jgi:hypothetical protein